jgi:DNA-binding transcriptional regulator YiaG
VPKAPPDAVAKASFTAKIIKALRRKLGVSQGDLGKLAGVSTNSVYKWEQNRWRLKIRQGTAAALLALRGMGKREVRARLGKTRK